jgi:hypothetical protein
MAKKSFSGGLVPLLETNQRRKNQKEPVPAKKETKTSDRSRLSFYE